MNEVTLKSRSGPLKLLGLAALLAVLLVSVGSAFAQLQAGLRRDRGKAVTLYAQWYNEPDPQLILGLAATPNQPAKQALYFFVLYEDGTIEKRMAPVTTSW